MDWSSFVARRRLDVTAWCARNKFTTYGAVKKWCKEHDVQAPEKHVVGPHLVKKAKPPVQPQPIPETPVAPAPKKKRGKSKPSSIVG